MDAPRTTPAFKSGDTSEWAIWPVFAPQLARVIELAPFVRGVEK